MKILAVGCHPDDLEICCYGTLAKYVAQGNEVSVCNVANGNLGHVEIMQDELAKIRLAEAQAAAKVIGATHYAIDVGDMHVNGSDRETIRKLALVIRDVAPDVIITHYEKDYMEDHIQTYIATFNASFAASLPHYDLTAKSNVAPPCPLFHFDTASGVGFVPTEYVDITDFIDKKLEALACHESQLKWLFDHDGIDMLDFSKTCAKTRGYQCGVTYAEGFRRNLNYLRMVPRRMLP